MRVFDYYAPSLLNSVQLDLSKTPLNRSRINLVQRTTEEMIAYLLLLD